MFDAVVARKARMEMVIDGLGKQPREDLVTSALFGTVRFLTPTGQKRALEALIGATISGPVDIYLWPYLRGEKENAEPDVVIRSIDGSYWIVEVKWGADLGENQVVREIRSVQQGECRRGGLPKGSRKVIGYTLLGALDKHTPAVDDARLEMGHAFSLYSLSWTAVTEKLRELVKKSADDPGLVAWAKLAATFLGGEPEGRVLGEWPVLKMPQSCKFLFSEEESFPTTSSVPLLRHAGSASTRKNDDH